MAIRRRLATKIFISISLLAITGFAADMLLSRSASVKSSSPVSQSSVLLPKYLPSGAYVWQRTSATQKGSHGMANVLYRLPGEPAKSSPTYPFRIISITEGSIALYDRTFPRMSFTTDAKESLKTGFTVNGGPARLYSSTSINGWDELEWMANGIETSIGTCSSCGVSVSQLFQIARSMSG